MAGKKQVTKQINKMGNILGKNLGANLLTVCREIPWSDPGQGGTIAQPDLRANNLK